MASVTVQNAGRLDRRFAAMPKTLERELERGGTRESARRIQATARGDAPVGESGLLVRSIRIRQLSRKRLPSDVGWEVYIDLRILYSGGATNNYAAMQNYGTRYVKPDRFMTDAVKRNANRSMRALAKSAKVGIHKGARRG